MLRREDWPVERVREPRLYRLERLRLRMRGRRRKKISLQRGPTPLLTAGGQCRAMDFVYEQQIIGRKTCRPLGQQVHITIKQLRKITPRLLNFST